MANQYSNLNAQKALIWRIVHRDNLPWILDNGVHCRNSATQAPNYVNIGNEELIDKRAHRVVPVGPGGTLSDYVPFYFTPFSPMMYNIKTGYGGIRKRSNEEIIILVSSLHRVHQMGVRFVFTDRHAIRRWRNISTILRNSLLSTGRCCRTVTSGGTLMIRRRLNATRPRRWCTTICRLQH